MPAWLVLLVVIPLVVAVPLILVFALIKRAIARAAEALASEGVELDSGPLTVTTRFKNFRSPEIYLSSAWRRNPGRIVLTKQRLHVLLRPQRYGIIERATLSHFTVDRDGEALRIHSADPPGASGSVTYSARVPDPDAWIAALATAGAKRAA